MLKDYVERGSDEAFAALAARYVNLVYSVALRAVGDPHAAEEISQAVFIILARKAGRLRSERALSSWLFQATRLTAKNHLRSRMRRHHREQEAYDMQALSTGPEPDLWPDIAPLLDTAIAALGEKDRTAVLTRYYEGKSMDEVGAAIGASEPATEKRVSRAMDKLQRFFAKRGVHSTAEALSKAVSTHSIQIAPAMLAQSVIAAALAKNAVASVSTLALAKGTLKTMTWLQIKAVAGIATALIVGGAAVGVFQGSNNDGWQPSDIIKKSRDTYAALTSYRDEGTTADTIGNDTIAPHEFTIRLARPDLYRIAWRQDMGFFVSTGAVWSAGNGDQLAANGSPVKYPDKETALSAATGVSGRAAGSIPGTFFQMNWGDQLGRAPSMTRKKDEKIGDANCFVLTDVKNGRTRTLWIGKEDFLIRQIEHKTSAADLQALLEAEARKHPGLALPTSVSGDSTSIEIHSHIVVNQPFTKTDFNP